MEVNPYEAPQTFPDDSASIRRANIIATIRASVAELGLGLALILLLILQIATVIPGHEKGFYQKVAMLGCAGLVHPYRWPFWIGVVSLAVYVLLLF